MSTSVMPDVRKYDVVILGAGYAGLMAALRLNRKNQPLRVALINVTDRFVERVRLQESIVAEVERRIPSISALLAGTRIEFICGRIVSLDDRYRAKKIDNRIRDQILSQVHCKRDGLQHEIIAISIDDYPGQAVALAPDHAAKFRIHRSSFPVFCCLRDPAFEEIQVKILLSP